MSTRWFKARGAAFQHGSDYLSFSLQQLVVKRVLPTKVSFTILHETLLNTQEATQAAETESESG